jgi:hypothetical protein
VLPLALWILVGVVWAAMASTVAYAARTSEPATVGPPGRWVWIITLGCAAYLATSAFATSVGAAAFLPVLAAGASAPSAVRWYLRLLSQAGFSQPLKAMGTNELCRRWLDSDGALTHAGSDRARLRIINSRQQCLDELERRDPEAFQAWLDSPPGTGIDPRRFFTDHGSRG